MLMAWLSGTFVVAQETGVAASNDGGDQAEKQVPHVTSLQHLPHQTVLATLSNGLTVIIQEYRAAPVATVRCYVRNTGSAFEGKHLGAGLSHVLEHVVAGGSTATRSEKEIEKIIDSFGGATNAYTSNSLTAYYIDCPARNLDTAIEILADWMQHCAFVPQEFERELKVVKQELADGEVNRARVLWKMLHQTVYTQHPIRHPTIGYLDVLSQTTNEAIIEFYRERYVPNNQVVVVVGDVDPDHVLQRVAECWAGTPRGPETYVPMPDEPVQLSPREAIREMDGNTIDFAFVWPTVPLSHPDLYALDVAAYILGHGRSSRLQHKLRIARPIVLDVSAISYTPHFVRGWFGITGSCVPENFEQAQKEILQEVYRLREELVGEAELAKAKKQKATELYFDRLTVQQIAESLGRNYLSTGDPLYDDHYVEGIQRVTAEQIRAVARRYFRPETLNRIIIAPPGKAPQSYSESTQVEQHEATLHRLSNGLRVIVKPMAHTPLVNMQLYLLGANLVDSRQQAGRASLVANMLTKGTQTMSARQIAEFFDSLGGTFGSAAGRNTLYLSATVLNEDFPKAFRVFADCALHPAFPEEEFTKVKTLFLGEIKARKDDPRQEALEAFLDALPAGSPYAVVPKEETVQRLQLSDIRSYYEHYFTPENMVLTIYGGIDREQALQLAEEVFGKLPASKRPPEVSFDKPNCIENTRRIHKPINKPTAVIFVGFPGPSLRDEKDHAAITVLDAAISGYRYPGGWLHNELRGAGLVYYVHAYLLSGPAPGFFVVQAQTSPDKADEVVQRILRNIEKVKQGKITKEEMENAKKMIIALHAQENTTPSQQAEQAALFELYGLGYDYDESFDARISAVTLEDISRVAKKYLNNCIVLVASPYAQ